MTELRDALQLHDLRKELTILRKVNADLLEAMESIAGWDVDDLERFERPPCGIRDLALTAINHAANDMRFGITEKKEQD
jgi:hypothetical protein